MEIHRSPAELAVARHAIALIRTQHTCHLGNDVVAEIGEIRDEGFRENGIALPIDDESVVGFGLRGGDQVLSKLGRSCRQNQPRRVGDVRVFLELQKSLERCVNSRLAPQCPPMGQRHGVETVTGVGRLLELSEEKS